MPHTCSPQSISSFHKTTTQSASLPPWPSLVFFWRLTSVATNHDINMSPLPPLLNCQCHHRVPFKFLEAYLQTCFPYSSPFWFSLSVIVCFKCELKCLSPLCYNMSPTIFFMVVRQWQSTWWLTVVRWIL